MVNNMVTIPHIPQNTFFITIAIIAVVGLIFLIIQWRRIRVATNNIKSLTKEAEHRKIVLVERDMESYRMSDEKALTKDDEKLNFTKEDASDIMHKVRYLNTEINSRVDHLESTAEYQKIQNLITDIGERENELERKGERVKRGNIF
jgi:hypothetical protein